MNANAMDSYKALMAFESHDIPTNDERNGMFLEYERLAKKRRTNNENKLLDRYWSALSKLKIIA